MGPPEVEAPSVPPSGPLVPSGPPVPVVPLDISPPESPDESVADPSELAVPVAPSLPPVVPAPASPVPPLLPGPPCDRVPGPPNSDPGPDPSSQPGTATRLRASRWANRERSWSGMTPLSPETHATDPGAAQGIDLPRNRTKHHVSCSACRIITRTPRPGRAVAIRVFPSLVRRRDIFFLARPLPGGRTARIDRPRFSCAILDGAPRSLGPSAQRAPDHPQEEQGAGKAAAGAGPPGAGATAGSTGIVERIAAQPASSGQGGITV